MKKYFISNTDEEVKFGDELELTMTKFEDGIHQVRVDHYKFTKEIAPTLITQGVIEVEDTEKDTEEDTEETKDKIVKDKSTIDFSKDDDTEDTHEEETTDEDEEEDEAEEFMEALTSTLETVGACIKNLEGRVSDLEAEIKELKEGKCKCDKFHQFGDDFNTDTILKCFHFTF